MKIICTWRFSNHFEITGTAVINLHSLNVVILGIVCIEHCGCDVRTVLASVTFTGDVNLATMQVEGVEQILPEAQKVSCNIYFAQNLRWCAWCVS